jgi:hypothetical protein
MCGCEVRLCIEMRSRLRLDIFEISQFALEEDMVTSCRRNDFWQVERVNGGRASDLVN